MKWLIGGLVTLLVTSLALPLSATAANLNNFAITDYEIDYRLAKDEAGRSSLQTTETITANFPPNQNRGIERVVPRNYDGHPVGFDIVSVTDQQGANRQYSTYVSNDNTVIRIGDPSRYVSGVQTYVINYTQSDVTKTFADHQEFYWDTNGTDWRVPIQHLAVRLTVDPAITGALNGQASCYQGQQSSTESCQLTNDNGQFTVTASNLSAGENVTIALGFQAEIFAEYQTPLWQTLLLIWFVVQALISIAAVGLIIWLTVRYYRLKQRSREHDPIVPEYLPPSDASVEVSARLLGLSSLAYSAQIIDLAVRHYLKIREIKPKSTFKSAEYELEIVKSIDSLMAEEREFLSDLFSGQTAVGSKLNMKTLQNNTAVYASFQDNPKKTKALVRGQYGLRHQVHEQSAWFQRASGWLLLIGVVLLSPTLLLVALMAFVQSKLLWPLTDKGLALVRYLKGLKMYIKVAEADRIKLLQSPEGAEKVGDTSSPAKLVKLYERVLPYAILFGVEKDWNKQLGRYYEETNTQPDWYSGYSGAVFSAAAFSSAMTSFKTTSYSTSSSSSSSGSSGGGFSGGGGGGGGGGGW